MFSKLFKTSSKNQVSKIEKLDSKNLKNIIGGADETTTVVSGGDELEPEPQMGKNYNVVRSNTQNL